MISEETTCPPMIPLNLWGGMRDYILFGVPPGGFLTAVIENDLAEAMGRADSQSRRSLFDIVSYFYNETPSQCWGSPEKMTAWMTERQEETA